MPGVLLIRWPLVGKRCGWSLIGEKVFGDEPLTMCRQFELSVSSSYTERERFCKARTSSKVRVLLYPF